jgi:hypothetical protein
MPAVGSSDAFLTHRPGKDGGGHPHMDLVDHLPIETSCSPGRRLEYTAGVSDLIFSRAEDFVGKANLQRMKAKLPAVPHVAPLTRVEAELRLVVHCHHRLVDGAEAARFLVTINNRLAEGSFEAELSGYEPAR